jgi:hypothetical protein
MVLKTWALRKADQKHLGSFEMWFFRITEEISWTDCLRNEEVLHRVKKERSILHTMQRGKSNLIGDILCSNWRLNHVIEGKEEGIRDRKTSKNT